jgi:ribonuclease-3
MNQLNNFSQLESAIKYTFADPQKLNQALIHRSYLNENRHQHLTSNERYEFLGDAVLELWASTTLFQRFPQFNEGDLTNLRALVVRTESLAQVAQNIELGQFILLSKGEEQNGGRHNLSILADTFESLLGAIYLDTGLESAFNFLNTYLLPQLDLVSQKKIYKDPKSLFQEIAQAKEGITPHYQTLEESGPDHHKTFTVGVYLESKLIATGQGQSKQAAQEAASQKAIETFNNS